MSYHYLAPQDYQIGEFGKYGTDCVSKFIRVCAALEFATDLKTVGSDDVRNALVMTMDGKRPFTDCLSKLENTMQSVTKDHFLTPSKYY